MDKKPQPPPLPSSGSEIGSSKSSDDSKTPIPPPDEEIKPRWTRKTAPPGSEYRRTCKRCGKVWHSLLSREHKINTDAALNSCVQSTQCCNPGAMMQAKRNVEAGQSEISRLKRCPECQSADYKQKIVARGE